MRHGQNAALVAIRNYLASYCHFADPDITLPLSYWIAGTYIFEPFDTFPYMIITAKVKRAGKTRLSELIGFAANMPFNVAGATAPALFRKIRDDKPTIIWDEAEALSSEASGLVRSFLNVGYRKGQMIPRATGDGVTEWPTYCPKVFVLIGDVYDTLRDRSIIVEMQRGEVMKRFSYETAKQEGLDCGDNVKPILAAASADILDAYTNERLPFLSDRDEEIWLPLFALCKTLEPDNYEKLQRIAADLAADKMNPVKYVENKDAEAAAQNEEYGRMLLRDMIAITRDIKGNRFGKRFIASTVALEKLKAIPTSPWRKYHSPSATLQNGTQQETGLTMQTMSNLLQPLGVTPGLFRDKKVSRGYHVDAIEAAAKKHKVSL